MRAKMLRRSAEREQMAKNTPYEAHKRVLSVFGKGGLENSLGAWNAVYRVGLKRLATATPTAAPARTARSR